jgi:hypothetical protein
VDSNPRDDSAAAWLAVNQAEVSPRSSRMAAGDTVVVVTGQVRRDLVGTPWDDRFQPVDAGVSVRRLAGIELYRLGAAVCG